MKHKLVQEYKIFFKIGIMAKMNNPNRHCFWPV